MMTTLCKKVTPNSTAFSTSKKTKVKTFLNESPLLQAVAVTLFRGHILQMIRSTKALFWSQSATCDLTTLTAERF